jgi:hypothetical protein
MIKKGKVFTITVYTDAGHGWGKVKRKVLDNLGIAPDVSSYSYQYKDNVYLEEDCDLSLLLQRLHSDNVSVKWVTKHTDGDSKIRSYERYEHVQDTNQTA